MTHHLELQIADLEAQNAKLRAEIDNLQAPRPAPTIVDVIGHEAFERMVELYPSFRESGTPTNPTDTATEVLWSAIRYIGRVTGELRKAQSDMQAFKNEVEADQWDLKHYRRALAKVAVHYIDGEYPL